MLIQPKPNFGDPLLGSICLNPKTLDLNIGTNKYYSEYCGNVLQLNSIRQSSSSAPYFESYLYNEGISFRARDIANSQFLLFVNSNSINLNIQKINSNISIKVSDDATKINLIDGQNKQIELGLSDLIDENNSISLRNLGTTNSPVYILSNTDNGTLKNVATKETNYASVSNYAQKVNYSTNAYNAEKFNPNLNTSSYAVAVYYGSYSSFANIIFDSNMASYASYVELSDQASYATTATTASYANSSSYVVLSYGYANISDKAAYVATAKLANLANYAVSAYSSPYSIYSSTASYANNFIALNVQKSFSASAVSLADYSDLSLYAGTASYAHKASISSYASYANLGISSNSSSYASVVAQSPSYSSKSSYSSYSLKSDLGSYASYSTKANLSSYSVQASYAQKYSYASYISVPSVSYSSYAISSSVSKTTNLGALVPYSPYASYASIVLFGPKTASYAENGTANKTLVFNSNSANLGLARYSANVLNADFINYSSYSAQHIFKSLWDGAGLTSIGYNTQVIGGVTYNWVNAL
jgi:hypothetical protein